MKTLLTIAGAWLCLAVPSHAALFGGKIEITITWARDWILEDYPDLIGDLSGGSYTYESSTRDGSFTPATANLIIRGFDGMNDPKRIVGYPDRPKLVVKNGVIIEMRGSGEDGFTGFGIEREGGEWNWDSMYGGTFIATDPARLSPVPDYGATLPLLALAFSPILLRSRFRSR